MLMLVASFFSILLLWLDGAEKDADAQEEISNTTGHKSRDKTHLEASNDMTVSSMTTKKHIMPTEGSSKYERTN